MPLSKRPAHLIRHWRTLLATLALTTAGAHAQLQTAKLVKDANALKQYLPANIGWMEPIGQNVVFSMDSLAYGKELWISDGTAKGTRLLKDIAPGTAGSEPQQGLPFGSGANTKVAFLTQRGSYVSDSSTPPELALWVTDGTAAGTVRVFESAVPAELGNTYLVGAASTGIFIQDSSTGLEDANELFFSDGTPQGTRSLNPLVNDVRKFSDPKSYGFSGAWCYFIANDEEVWRSDGTDAGTTKVATFPDLTPSSVEVVGENVFINVIVDRDKESELWVCPAAGGTPARVAPAEGTDWPWIVRMASVGSKLVFTIQDKDDKPQLWVTDGTAAATVRIPVTLPGQTVESEVGYSLTKWQGAAYFCSIHDDVASGLWRTDGTAAGTTHLGSVKAPYAISDGMVAGTDAVYYIQSTAKGNLLARTQGTPSTTLVLKGTPYLSSYSPMIAPTASSVFMLSAQGTAAEVLCRAKNAKGGTMQLTRPQTINGTGMPSHPIGAPPVEMSGSNLLEFVDAGRGQELWQVDPATGKSRSLFRLSLPGTIGFRGMTPAGPLFSRYVFPGGTEVYVMGGKKNNTVVLTKDTAANAYDFTKLGDLWFCSAAYPSTTKPAPIMKTDGTVPGTSTITAADGTTPNRLGNMVAFQGSIWFIAVTSNGTKRELWRTDGTPAGTVRVANTWYGDASETIGNLSVAGGKLFFSVTHSSKQYIWQSDGTTAGTAEVSSSTTFSSVFTPAVDLGGVPLFQARQTSDADLQWWAIRNGDISMIASPPNDAVSKLSTDYPKHAVLGNKLLFTASSDGDSELWATDGTDAGTHRVKDIFPGRSSSKPSQMLVVGGYVYFVAADDEHGRELWRTDGTGEGTVVLADVEPGQRSSTPISLKAMNGKLYFYALRRTIGYELYSVELPQ